MAGIGELVVGALLLGLGPTSQPARDRTAWVAETSVEGDVQPEGGGVFDLAFREGLSRGGFELRPDPDPETCGAAPEAGCHVRAARRAEADYAVALSVSVTRRDYAIAVLVLDARTGESIAESRETCDVCGVAEATAVVDSVAGAISARLDALALEPPTLAFRSRPSAVLIRVDGDVVGETPFERSVPPGTHIVRAEKTGFVPEERSIEAVPGVSSSVMFELEPTPEDPGMAAARDRRRRWGWGMTGVGAGSVLTGATLIGVHGLPNRLQCGGDEVDQDGDCKFILATRVPGIVVGVVGVGLVSAGVALWVRNRPRRRVAATVGGIRF
ncbi:MAG: PEGA domain-containing protein [Nannocystales bacterium]